MHTCVGTQIASLYTHTCTLVTTCNGEQVLLAIGQVCFIRDQRCDDRLK